MVLHANVTFVVITAAVVEQVESSGPLLLRELALLQKLGPRWCPQVILHNLNTILQMLYMSVVTNNLYVVPLSVGLRVLRLCGNHVIER